MYVKLTFTKEAREQAIATRKMRGIETPDDFEGAEFKDAIKAGFNNGFFAVVVKDGDKETTYLYSYNSIARIKTSE